MVWIQIRIPWNYVYKGNMSLEELENYGFGASHSTTWDHENCKMNFPSFFFFCNGELDQTVILHLFAKIYFLFNHLMNINQLYR